MKFVDLRKALTAPLNSLNLLQPIQWPNAPIYTPQIGETYITVDILPNQPSVSTLGATGYDEHTGVMQIVVVSPKAQTDFPALNLASEIEQAYQVGIRQGYFTQGTVSAKITSVGISAAQADDTWYRLPINVLYRAHITGVTP